MATATTTEQPQCMTALGRANEVRLARCAMKRDLKAGRATLGAALSADCMANMTVIELLLAQHRWGRTRALAVLNAEQISESRLVGKLTDRQRAALADACR